MKTSTRAHPLLFIGTACVLVSFGLFYATISLGQLAVLSGTTFMDDLNEPVGYRAPFVLWALPFVLLVAGIACLVVGIRALASESRPAPMPGSADATR